MMRQRNAITIDGTEYAPGKRFRVISSGAVLSGMVSDARWANAYGGWQQKLEPGDIVTCTGFGPGFGSDPGYGVEFETRQSLEARAMNCDISPSAGGIWQYHPASGLLEEEATE